MSIFAIFFGLPLFFTGLTFQGVVFKADLLLFLAAASLLAWAAKGVVSGEWNRRTPLIFPLPRFSQFIFFPPFVPLTAGTASGDFRRSFARLMNIVALVIAYYLIISHFNAQTAQNNLVAIVSSGFLASVWMTLGILGRKFLPDKLMNFAPCIFIVSAACAGAYFGLLIPLIITVVFVVRASEKINKNLKIGLTIVSFGGTSPLIYFFFWLFTPSSPGSVFSSASASSLYIYSPALSALLKPGLGFRWRYSCW